ncbi:hypothetical protein [Niallia endozanthoxylica]|uniref:Lipoprotein n=1 Tax=Niallia endozanthoxylica TaxID=2036016 RepID=A0A5J5H2W7_9BACI|nr:hypothetical protein [Niallia endozanthoxylica]KAA9014916.1 hypothetical protein F4V44_23255 [Niallia endozanthoxylica]
MQQLLRNVLLCMGVILLLVGCSEKEASQVEKSYEEYDIAAEEHLLNEMLIDKKETGEKYEIVAFNGFEEKYNQMLYRVTYYNPEIKKDSLYMISVVKKGGEYEAEDSIFSIKGDHFRKDPLKIEVLREDQRSLSSIDNGQLERLIEKYPEKSSIVHEYTVSQ